DQLNDVVFGTLQNWQISAPAPSADGTLLEWTFTPTQDVELAPQAFLELSLSKLVTRHPDGPTQIVLRYSAVPGYWDGEIVCPIEKAPLVFGHKFDAENDHRSNVGIRHSAPDAGLYLDGHLLLHRGQSQIQNEIQNGGPLLFRSDVDDKSYD